MLTYSFENIEGTLYEYVYNCIKNDIIEGNIKPGDKLPSKRSFARNNGVSTITIQNAYDQLASEGYIYAIQKKGYYVSDISGINVLPKDNRIVLDINIPKEEHYSYDLAGNKMSPENFPFSIWAKLTREVISTRRDDLMRTSPMAGVSELRGAIAEHLRSFRGMLIDPNQIVVGAGTEYLYGVIVQLLGNDKIYAIENPGYKKLVSIYKQYGVSPVYADLDDNGLSVEGLNKYGAEIAHICPNHHFPTGITMPVSRRYEMLAWANGDENRYIIEDDYDSEFRRNGKPISTLFSIDACEKVIYMNTFSKSLTPTIRMSYMVLPTHLANRLYEKLSFLSCTVSNFEQYTLAEFISKGYFEKHINRMRLYYLRQHEKIKDIIQKSSLGKKCDIIENDSGLHFIIKLDTRIPDNELGQKLKEKGVMIRSLSEYYLREEQAKEHLYIINYSNLNEEILSEACELIYGCLENSIEYLTKK